MTTRTVDARGRLTLGKEYANRLVIISTLEHGLLQITPAEAVPAREAWLYKNKDAITAVLTGLAQAEAGEFAEPPDMEAASRLASAIGE